MHDWLEVDPARDPQGRIHALPAPSSAFGEHTLTVRYPEGDEGVIRQDADELRRLLAGRGSVLQWLTTAVSCHAARRAVARGFVR